MNARSLAQYADIFGSSVIARMVSQAQRLIALGIFSHDDRDDLIQDFCLICYKALESYQPQSAKRETFLITCVNNRAKTLAVKKVKERSRLALERELPPMDDKEANLEEVEDAKEQEPRDLIDLGEMLSNLQPLDRLIVQAIANGETPAAACWRYGLPNSYFIRKLRPILKTLFKDYNHHDDK